MYIAEAIVLNILPWIPDVVLMDVGAVFILDRLYKRLKVL